MTLLIVQKMQILRLTIATICEISGTPGLSYGVVHNGELLHTDNIGYSNIVTKTRTTSDTTYFIGSLSKAFTSAAMGVLVEDGKITWDTLVRDVMGEDFHFSNPFLTWQMTIRDLLSHRMGLQRSNQLWTGSDNVLMIDKSKTIPHVQYLKPIQEFRSTVHYNNWGYALAGEIIEKISGESWGTFVERNFLGPLEMTSSSIKIIPGDGRLAKPYSVLDDGTFVPLPPIKCEDGSLMCSAGGVQSTVTDMLKWCQALNKAYNGQKDSPLKQIPELMEGVTRVAPPFDPSRTAFGMGWVRSQLPTVLGAVGCNPSFVKKMPIAGRGTQDLVIYHQGSTAGYTSSLFLVPRTQSAIIVLSNSISKNDASDWVGQTLLEALLDVKRTNNYIGYAAESAQAHIAKFPAMRKSLQANKIRDTAPTYELEAYGGRCHNVMHSFFHDVLMTNGNTDPSKKTLEVAFQGLDSQVWPMEHYNYDDFLWLMTRDEAVRRGRFTYNPETLYQFQFVPDDRGAVVSLMWKHDADGPTERFVRDE